MEAIRTGSADRLRPAIVGVALLSPTEPPPASAPDRLAGIAANPVANPRQQHLLQACLAGVEDGAALANTLPLHRVGPLLHWQINQYDLAAPLELRTGLAAQTLGARRQWARVSKVAQTLSTALAGAGIESVLLKGSALARSIYPEPWLRPMDDVDILVPERAMADVQRIFAGLGLQLRPPQTRAERLNHHWPLAAMQAHGGIVFVEVHQRVLNTRLGRPLALDALQRPLQRLDTGDGAVWSLRPEELLATQLVRFRHLTEILRAISVADVVGLAEVHRETIDWDRLRRRVPRLAEIFAALQAVTPLSDALCHTLGLNPEAASGRIALARRGYHGWPVNTHLKRRHGRPPARALLRDTLCPDRWWSQLAYANAPHGAGRLRTLGLDHPRNLLAQSLRRFYYGK